MNSDDDFKEVDFCKDCIKFNECSSSEFEIKLLEQYMIFSALSDTEISIEENFNKIFKNSNYTFEEVEVFMQNKKEYCIYFTNRKDI
jgi:hypothetical protein